MDNRIYIYIIDLPTKVHEMVTPCSDGYTIYINARLSEAGRLEAYDHAMWHIDHEDIEKGGDVQTMERSAWGRNEANSNLYASEHGQAGS